MVGVINVHHCSPRVICKLTRCFIRALLVVPVISVEPLSGAAPLDGVGRFGYHRRHRWYHQCRCHCSMAWKKFIILSFLLATICRLFIFIGLIFYLDWYLLAFHWQRTHCRVVEDRETPQISQPLQDSVFGHLLIQQQNVNLISNQEGEDYIRKTVAPQMSVLTLSRTSFPNPKEMIWSSRIKWKNGINWILI